MERGMRVLEAGLRDVDERLRSQTTHQRRDADDVAMALRGLSERSQSLDQQMTSLTHQVNAHQETLTQLSGMGDRVPTIESQLAGLRDLAAKLPELEEKVQASLRQHHELESSLEEKTHQGRREAEDIRSQLAPLLEDRVRRHESDALLFSEMERLRESLAESLHDLAERLRHAVRE
jgi:chromosome segregation ATPase